MTMRKTIVAAFAFVSILPGCPSGEATRGVEHPGTARSTSATTDKCRGPSMEAWTVPGFCLTRFAKDLVRPRGLVVAPNGDLLVATRSGIVVLWDANGDGESDEHERATLGGPDVSQHGVALSPDGK